MSHPTSSDVTQVVCVVDVENLEMLVAQVPESSNVCNPPPPLASVMLCTVAC